MNKHLLTVLGLLAASALLLIGVPALAHEQRDVGDYHLEFGWHSEPTYAEQLNQVEVFISKKGAAEGEKFPADIQVELKAEVTFGDKQMTIKFEQAEDDAGHYLADLIPTRPGDYAFHLTGNIGDMAVDEKFTSADGQFNSVDPSSDVLFPDDSMSVVALQAKIDALQAEVDDLKKTVDELKQKSG